MECFGTSEIKPIVGQQWRQTVSQVAVSSSVLLLSVAVLPCWHSETGRSSPAQQVTRTFGFMRKINTGLCCLPVQALYLSTVIYHKLPECIPSAGRSPGQKLLPGRCLYGAWARSAAPRLQPAVPGQPAALPSGAFCRTTAAPGDPRSVPS